MNKASKNELTQTKYRGKGRKEHRYNNCQPLDNFFRWKKLPNQGSNPTIQPQQHKNNSKQFLY